MSADRHAPAPESNRILLLFAFIDPAPSRFLRECRQHFIDKIDDFGHIIYIFSHPPCLAGANRPARGTSGERRDAKGERVDDTPCPRFNFIILPEFPLNALVLASDALRIANQNSGRDLFRWQFVSEDGHAVRASNGMWFPADCGLDDCRAADVWLLFEGNLPTQRNTRRLYAALREAARFGAIVGGVDTGAFALAQSGIINTQGGAQVTLHWEAVATFKERFPAAEIVPQIYLVDGKRVHCAGGVATLDMTLDLMAAFHGEALANEVANALVHTRREAQTEQRGDAQRDADANLAAALVDLMECNLDFPLTLRDLAAALGASERTVSRACRRAFGISPMRLYLRIRLQAARNLLFYEEHLIKDVATACGFSYPAVFSRVFKSEFGETPRAFRRTLREKQALGVRPEIHRLISKTVSIGPPF